MKRLVMQFTPTSHILIPFQSKCSPVGYPQTYAAITQNWYWKNMELPRGVRGVAKRVNELSHVYPSVCLSVSATPTVRISVIFDIGDCYKKICR
jgi:hypothetical protein